MKRPNWSWVIYSLEIITNYSYFNLKKLSTIGLLYVFGVLFFIVSCGIDKSDNQEGKDAKVVQQIKEHNLENLVIPHRINSLNRLRKVQKMGFSSWELDLVFYIEEGKAVFRVKHDDDSLTAVCLREYLQNTELNEVEKLWFDVKNINENTIQGVYNCLEQIDESFEIKHRVILETNYKGTSFKIFHDAGWHTSYYLPYFTINDWIKSGDSTSQRNYAIKLIKQINEQELSAISFDVICYPFVKKYLKEKLNEKIVYHTWDMSLSLDDRLVIEKYLVQPYVENKLIKTVLIPIK